jgi:hypothetical protein
MAAFTWTLQKCVICGCVERSRGVHKRESPCLSCGTIDGMQWEKVTYGREKYVGNKAGTKEIRQK